MTQCTQSSFEFEAHFRRTVVASFDGGALTSDAGALLLRQVDRRMGFLRRLAGCFTDFRSPWLTQHGVEQMLAQRVYGGTCKNSAQARSKQNLKKCLREGCFPNRMFLARDNTLGRQP
ncbi:MAG: transposase, partial [Bryobacteraceae bacterium]